MSVYLHDIPLPQAQARFQQALEEADLWSVLGHESIPLDENALGRVTAEPIWAKISSPHYHAAAMDGFALRARNTTGAMPSKPLLLQIGAEAEYVDTGDPLPDWADAVIPIESVESLDEHGTITNAIRDPAAIRIRASVAPWSHVRPLGEDIVASQLVLPSGHSLRPVDLGAVAAAGHHEIKVSRKPKVAILPTGTELVPIGSRVKAGDIFEFNSLVLAAQVIAMGGGPKRYPSLQDDFDLICQRVEEAAKDHDLVLLIAGSSAGAEDFSSQVVDELGTLLVHGVAVRPGHPVILGLINQNTSGTLSNARKGESTTKNRNSMKTTPGAARVIPIIGVPGYPVSAALTMDIFVEPLLARWIGRRPRELPTDTAILTRKIVSPPGDDDYVRVVLGNVGGKLLAAPLSRGAGVITSLVQADALALIPSGTQGVDAGDPVPVHLYRTRAEIEKTILAVGSHDISLDLMSQFLAEHDRRLVSANVGSQGGLIALRRGEAHIAGSHLLNPATGKYNISQVRQYMPGIPVKVVALVGREQGLIVAKKNPSRINGIGDLTRPDVRFVNRQRGAGTRVLLDYHLNSMTIPSDSIVGYGQEEYTHLGVAAAVASGRADCGLGIAAAAHALSLDFVPLFKERYDLVLPKQFTEDVLLAPLFDLLVDPAFRGAVSQLTGYDVSVMGTMILEDG